MARPGPRRRIISPSVRRGWWGMPGGSSVLIARWRQHRSSIRGSVCTGTSAADPSKGARGWVWFQTDGAKKPATVALLADELSQQALHSPARVKAMHATRPDQATVTLEEVTANKPTARTVKVDELYRGNAKARLESLKV